MRMFLLAVLFFCTLPGLVSAEALNAGFVEGIWLGSDSVFAGTPVRIYTAIRNNTGSDITGSVEFFDNDTRIGRRTISAIDGHIIESWTDWTPSYGDHTITAELTRVEIHTVGAGTEEVEVISARAEHTLFVDYDTDGDGIGNKTDTDDDGDNISDEEEIRNGTDPLVYTETAPEEGEDDEESDTSKEDEDEEADEKTTRSPSGSSDKEGLERYLTTSPAHSVLSSMTSVVNSTKERLDTYREDRNEKRTAEKESKDTETQTEETATSPTGDENGTGFGTITRTHATSESGGGFAFIHTIINLIGSLLGALYTFVLFILSVVLGHPILVQIIALSLFLLLLFFIARKIGRRPR